MNETKGRTTEELAYLLWEKQGRPENRSAENWLEAEYLSHSPSGPPPPTKRDNEADLRMRGLGLLTQGDPSTFTNSQPKLAVLRDSLNQVSTVGPVVASCIVGTVLMLGLGLVLSLFRKAA